MSPVWGSFPSITSKHVLYTIYWIVATSFCKAGPLVAVLSSISVEALSNRCILKNTRLSARGTLP